MELIIILVNNNNEKIQDTFTWNCDIAIINNN